MKQELIKSFLKTLKLPSKTAKKPVLLCLVGMQASGKTMLAKRIASKLPFVIVRSDIIRNFLDRHKLNGTYPTAYRLMIPIIRYLLSNNYNTILDADFSYIPRPLLIDSPSFPHTDAISFTVILFLGIYAP